ASMDIKCTKNELLLFKQIAIAAESLQMPCYLIGGFVRDKILARNTKDIDIVCVGDGIELAHKVAALFRPAPAVNYFKNFGTAQMKITFPLANESVNTSALTKNKNEIFDVEVVGARKES